MSKIQDPKRPFGAWLWSLVLAVLVLAPVQLAVAGGQSPDEGGEGVPFAAGPTGIALLGELGALMDLGAEFSGTGQVELLPLEDGRFAAILYGDIAVSVSRSILADSEVQIIFHVGEDFGGGLGHVGVGGFGSHPFVLPPGAVYELPLATYYAPEAQGAQRLFLDAISPQLNLFHAQTQVDGDVLTLSQRTNSANFAR